MEPSNTPEALPELIGAMDVAQLCGSTHRNFAFDRLERDHLFPKPVVAGRRGRGGNKSLWKRGDIEFWIQHDRLRAKRSDGRRLAFHDDFLTPIDRELARQFIIGRFDRKQSQVSQFKRIIRARNHGATIIKRIKTAGDWS
jgi:predicted DNA-binding transcriptional regulator AlpA